MCQIWTKSRTGSLTAVRALELFRARRGNCRIVLMCRRRCDAPAPRVIGCGWRVGREIEQVPHLVVARLIEVLVPETDGRERLRDERADHFVGNAAQPLA